MGDWQREGAIYQSATAYNLICGVFVLPAIRGRKQDTTPVAMSVAMQQLMLPLLLAMDATKKGLLSFVQQMGMVGQVIDDFRGGQAVAFQLHGQVAHRTSRVKFPTIKPDPTTNDFEF